MNRSRIFQLCVFFLRSFFVCCFVVVCLLVLDWICVHVKEASASIFMFVCVCIYSKQRRFKWKKKSALDWRRLRYWCIENEEESKKRITTHERKKKLLVINFVLFSIRLVLSILLCVGWCFVRYFFLFCFVFNFLLRNLFLVRVARYTVVVLWTNFKSIFSSFKCMKRKSYFLIKPLLSNQKPRSCWNI